MKLGPFGLLIHGHLWGEFWHKASLWEGCYWRQLLHIPPVNYGFLWIRCAKWRLTTSCAGLFCWLLNTLSCGLPAWLPIWLSQSHQENCYPMSHSLQCLNTHSNNDIWKYSLQNFEMCSLESWLFYPSGSFIFWWFFFSYFPGFWNFHPSKPLTTYNSFFL